MKTMWLIRGVSGSGKSTLAKELKSFMGESCVHLEADMYFYSPEGVYKYDPTYIRSAHCWCSHEAYKACNDEVENIIISNTFTQEKDLQEYEQLAKDFNYKLVSLIVENRHGNSNIHDVPLQKLDKQAARLKNNLKLK